jgi:hypothetical protein
MEATKSEDPQSKGDMDLDPYLLMEEIIEKLKILDYEALFTRIKYVHNKHNF